ncbi:hypothetical protein [Spirulina major]|uniref:hypothetical protein n=1 Tax=Spirulina major TaxID=270636 RepID=UPI000935389C|nr:hypothetical protein [Spirulina major]
MFSKTVATLVYSSAIALLSVLADPHSAIANDPPCDEYYIDPDGRRICLDNGRPVPADPVARDYLDPVPFLDRLARCQPAATAIGFPLIPDVAIESVVRAWEGDRCVVQMNAFLLKNPQRQAVYALCRYRRSTLALLTDPRAYEQARTGNYQFDSSDARDAALSEAMLQDCQFSRNWLPSLIQPDRAP